MRFKYFIIGLMLIIFGFIAFSSIAVLNGFSWMNLTYHILITLSGFILITIGIFSMFLFINRDNKNKVVVGDKTGESIITKTYDKKSKTKSKVK